MPITDSTNKHKPTYFLQIPSKLILDTDISTKAKYLYIILKKHSFNSQTHINYNTLMSALLWTDKRTLKRYLKELLDNNYINYSFTQIRGNVPMDVTIRKKISFIQIDIDLINKAQKVSENICNIEKGFLYLYFLEHSYNINYKYACPSLDEVKSVVKANTNDLNKIIKTYHDNYICEYVRGIFKKNSIERYRNRYIVNNVEYLESDNKNVIGNNLIGKKRYRQHKKIEFFFSNEMLNNNNSMNNFKKVNSKNSKNRKTDIADGRVKKRPLF